jgi:hypothetical protein
MKKILFNDKYDLTQSVLEGRKTMTRRESNYYEGPTVHAFIGGRLYLYKDSDKKEFLHKSHYCIGDVVAVAQRYMDVWENEYTREECAADELNSYFLKYEKGWTNKMFVKSNYMPHHIRITNIKVERLQDISDEDCLKEGIMIDGNRLAIDDNIYVFDAHGSNHVNRWYFPSPKEAFAALIDKVSGKGTWDKNPLVIAYSFELVD